MAQIKTFKFGKSMMMVGDGAGAETFDAPCGFDQLTMTMQTQENTVFLPDCDDPDAVAWGATDLTGVQMRLEGSGLLDTDALQLWHTWFFTNTGAEKNVRWFRDITAGEGGGYYQAPAVLTGYSETASRGNRWNVTISVALNGKPTFTPAS